MSQRGQEGLKRNMTLLDVKPHFYFLPRKRDHVKPSFRGGFGSSESVFARVTDTATQCARGSVG